MQRSSLLLTLVYLATCLVPRPPCLRAFNLSPSTHESLYIRTSSHFSFHIKWVSWCTTESSAIGRFLLTTLFQGHPEWCWSTAATHFWLNPQTELTHPWSNSGIFYSCQLVIRNPLHSHRYEWRERGWHSSDGGHMRGSQLPSYAACLGLLVLLFLSLWWNTSILWWVIAGPAWPYNLVYVTEPLMTSSGICDQVVHLY